MIQMFFLITRALYHHLHHLLLQLCGTSRPAVIKNTMLRHVLNSTKPPSYFGYLHTNIKSLDNSILPKLQESPNAATAHICHIITLPIELLLEVFEMAIVEFSEKSLVTALVISHTCLAWRSIVLHQPELWYHNSLIKPLEDYLRMIESQSSTFPVRVQISNGDQY